MKVIDNVLMLIYASTVQSCVRIFDRMNGSVVSEGPCKYEIRTSTGHWIHLKWLSFQVDDITSNCRTNYIEVKIGCNNTSRILTRLCNINKDCLPHDLYSVDECMTIEYVDNRRIGDLRNGFSAVYSIKPIQVTALPGGCNPGFIYDNAGTLKSPHWPNTYYNQVSNVGDCQWTLKLTEHAVLRIVFMNVDVYSTNRSFQCSSGDSDYLLLKAKKKCGQEVVTYKVCNQHSLSWKEFSSEEFSQVAIMFMVKNRDHNHTRKGFVLGYQTSYEKDVLPKWPSEFRWSSTGPIAGYYCMQILENSEPVKHSWTNNYFCSKYPTHMRWSSHGPIQGMRCTRIRERSDPHTWSDNYLCVPNNSTFHFSWSSAGPIKNAKCLQWKEPSDPHTWNDNYLCSGGYKNFDMFQQNGSLKVMGGYHGFPKATGAGRMIISSIEEDVNFKCSKVVIWRNIGGYTSPYQWLGWQDRVFANRVIKYRFWIKFLDQVPQKSANFGMKVYGTVYNDFVDNCLPNKWCKVEKTITCGSSGDSNHVILIFDSIDHHQTIHISQLTVDLLLKELVWPDDFKWSHSGQVPGYECLQIIEGSEPDDHSWKNNYFCSRYSIGMEWSMAGSIKGMRCTRIRERSDPHTWSDNYLCVPNNSPFHFSWSSAGPIKNAKCLQWKEPSDPHTWNDNYLCSKAISTNEHFPVWGYPLCVISAFAVFCYLRTVAKKKRPPNCPAPGPATHASPAATPAPPPPAAATPAVQGSSATTPDANVELPDSVEKRYEVFKQDGALNSSLKIMGNFNDLPRVNNVGQMFVGGVDHDDQFQCSQKVTWKNTAGRKGPYQWLGWQDEAFANRVIKYRFWIKFLDQVPQKSANFGMKVYGTIYNDFVDNCLPNKWCKVEKTITCGSSGDSNHVILIFDSIDHHQTIHISQLEVDVLNGGAYICPSSSTQDESGEGKIVPLMPDSTQTPYNLPGVEYNEPPPSYEEAIALSSFGSDAMNRDLSTCAYVNGSYL